MLFKTFFQGLPPRFSVICRHPENSAPWLTTGLLKFIKTKPRLFQLFLKSRSHEHESNYKKLKTNLTFLIRVDRRNYYNKKIDMARSNLKQTWKILNGVINRQVAKAPYPVITLPKSGQICQVKSRPRILCPTISCAVLSLNPFRCNH